MDNSDNKNNETPEIKDNSQKTESEKLERYKQQIAGSKAESDRLRSIALDSEVRLAETDANSIVELHGKDPKLAEEVAKKFGYSSYEDAQTAVSGKSEVNVSEQSEEDKFNEWYKKKKADEVNSNANSKADEIFAKLDESLQEQAKKHYDMMAGGRNLTVDQATEMAKMATLYVNKDKLKGDKFTEGLMSLGNSGLGGSQKTETNSKNDEFGKGVFGGKFEHLYK